MRFWGKFMIGAFLGGIFGALVGILIAPASGSELRERFVGGIQQIQEGIREASAEKRMELQAELSRLRQPKESA